MGMGYLQSTHNVLVHWPAEAQEPLCLRHAGDEFRCVQATTARLRRFEDISLSGGLFRRQVETKWELGVFYLVSTPSSPDFIIRGSIAETIANCHIKTRDMRLNLPSYCRRAL